MEKFVIGEENIKNLLLELSHLQGDSLLTSRKHDFCIPLPSSLATCLSASSDNWPPIFLAKGALHNFTPCRTSRKDRSAPAPGSRSPACSIRGKRGSRELLTPQGMPWIQGDGTWALTRKHKTAPVPRSGPQDLPISRFLTAPFPSQASGSRGPSCPFSCVLG